MKLLLFSDLHCNANAAQQLVDMAHASAVDVVIGAGDFGNMRRGLNVTIDILTQLSCPAIVVPGNAESVEELAAACQGWSNARVLHGSGVTIDGIDFYGLGGGVPITPFGAWSYDFSEEVATALLTDCPASGVLVSHSPPRGTVDVSRGRSLGSTAIRDTIIDKQLQLVVCGAYPRECRTARVHW